MPWHKAVGGWANVWKPPRPAGRAAAEYVRDLIGTIDTATRDWTPDLVIISSGFDSMMGDPLGSFTLAASDYKTITDRLRALDAPVVGVLEGGYALDNLVAGSIALTEALA